MKSIILIISLFCSSTITFGQAYQLEVSWPVQRMIFQRSTSNTGIIEVAGMAYRTTKTFLNPQYSITENSWSGVFTIEARLDKLNLSNGSLIGGSPTVDWTAYTNVIQSPSVINGRFLISINNVPGGWYKLSLRVKDGSGVIRATNEVSKVGIGDVFLIAGQSNAEGTSETGGYNPSTDGNKEPSLSSFSYWDGVNSVNGAFDGQHALPNSSIITQLTKDSRIAPTGENGWCWGALGYLIASNKNVPVLFFNCAVEGTPSKSWSESSPWLESPSPLASTTTMNPWISCNIIGNPPTNYFAGVPFVNMRNALSSYCNTFGVRAILWHQGESDTFFFSNTCYLVGDYESNLNTLINTSRSKFESSLGWVISKASRINGAVNSTIISKQNILGTQSGNYCVGPNTDLIIDRNIDMNGYFVHFRNDLLDKVAVDWYNAISTAGPNNIFDNANITPIIPKTLMNVSVATSGSNFILTPSGPSGITRNDWNTTSPSLNFSSQDATGTTLAVPNDAFARNYRTAIFSDINRKARISVPFRRLGTFISNSGSGYRIASLDDSLIDSTDSYKLFPNPTNNDVKIELNGLITENTNFEIITGSGEVIYSITGQSIDKENQLSISGKVFKESGFYFLRIHDGFKPVIKRFYVDK